MEITTITSILAMLGVSALDDIFKGDRSSVTNRITKLATILRGKSQAEVDKIYDQLIALPAAANYTGVVKEAMLKTHQELADKYRTAKEKQTQQDAIIAAAESNAATYDNQSGIGELFNKSPKNRALESEKELDNLLKVENKA